MVEAIERNNHQAFATQVGNFHECYNFDYCEDVWQGVTIIKRQLSRMLCKNKADAGLVCVTEKSNVISFSKIPWNHVKKSSLGVTTHTCSSKTRVPQLEHNFGLRSAVEPRVRCHIQHKTQEELETLKQIVGKHSLHGRRQNLPSKKDGYYSPLNLNDNIN